MNTGTAISLGVLGLAFTMNPSSKINLIKIDGLKSTKSNQIFTRVETAAAISAIYFSFIKDHPNRTTPFLITLGVGGLILYKLRNLKIG